MQIRDQPPGNLDVIQAQPLRVCRGAFKTLPSDGRGREVKRWSRGAGGSFWVIAGSLLGL